jgi:predicted component of type VI protein secretion system
VVVARPQVVPWHLVVEGGPTWRLTGTRVVLGRRPQGAGAGAQELAIPDSSRTLSKVHARLELFDGVWTVTDLDATNGVIVVEADGTETLLDPGASARLTERFVLGRVAMRVVAGDGVA